VIWGVLFFSSAIDACGRGCCCCDTTAPSSFEGLVVAGVSTFMASTDDDAAEAEVLLLWPPNFASRLARILSASESMTFTKFV
jgi:hypothetical protein